MANPYSEPKPGTAIKIITEEHMYLNEFMEMLERKLRLDEKRLDDLKALRSSWNPKWSDSGIWPLISPVLKYIGDGIDFWAEATRDVASRLADVPRTPIPGVNIDGSFNPLEMPECLERPHEEFERCHKVMLRPETQSALTVWPKGHPSRSMILPEADRDYRKAVVKQQRSAALARTWYEDKLPVALEQHQQRAEDIKKFLRGCLNSDSKYFCDLSVSCTSAIHSTAQFVSTEYIGPRHVDAEQETSHILLQDAEYRNYLYNGHPCSPLLGLGTMETVAFILKIWEAVNGEVFDGYHSTNCATGFQMEKESLADPDLPWRVTVHWRDRLRGLFRVACLCDHPVLEISDELRGQYSNGVPRGKLKIVLDTIAPVSRRDILRIIIGPRDTTGVSMGYMKRYKEAAHHLAHNVNAAPIIESIWRKWDLEGDCPFPTGVVRVGDSNFGVRIIWKKTQNLYVSPNVH